MMSCITPTKRLDMWFKDLSVNTTEYSSSPSGSTSRRGRVTSADCHRSTHRAGPPCRFQRYEHDLPVDPAETSAHTAYRAPARMTTLSVVYCSAVMSVSR